MCSNERRSRRNRSMLRPATLRVVPNSAALQLAAAWKLVPCLGDGPVGPDGQLAAGRLKTHPAPSRLNGPPMAAPAQVIRTGSRSTHAIPSGMSGVRVAAACAER